MVYQRTDIGYCSNVHAGETVSEMIDNMTRFIQPVCCQLGLSSISSGLWVSAQAATELQSQQTLSEFKEALQTANVRLTSINGFPYGGFHQPIVKERVYRPDWSDPARLTYSKNLADVLASCLPEDQNTGAISTVPLGYKREWHSGKQRMAMTHLKQLTEYLHQVKERTGKLILFCLEMEPDCVLEATDELLVLFMDQLRPQLAHYEYLGVCYDVCHQAVMSENAYEALQRITQSGIPIGKIQLSSALQAVFTDNTHDTSDDQTLADLLAAFCEPKYLHQVKCVTAEGHLLGRSDLPEALSDTRLRNHWRIHFHVPIHATHLLHSQLKTTRSELLRVFDFLRDHPAIRPCLEVETYSWQLLPMAIRPKNNSELIMGITNELRWVESELRQRELVV